MIVHHSRQLQTGPSHLCGGGGCVSIISTNDCIYMLCAVWELLCKGQNDENLISLSPSQSKKPPDQDVCPEYHLTILYVLCGHTTGSSIYIHIIISRYSGYIHPPQICDCPSQQAAPSNWTVASLWWWWMCVHNIL